MVPRIHQVLLQTQILNVTDAEVVEQIQEVQEVGMEVKEVEEEADSLVAVTTAGEKIRALLDTGCLVRDCISKQVVDKCLSLIF
jgi:hypothetical protein